MSDACLFFQIKDEIIMIEMMQITLKKHHNETNLQSNYAEYMILNHYNYNQNVQNNTNQKNFI